MHVRMHVHFPMHVPVDHIRKCGELHVVISVIYISPSVSGESRRMYYLAAVR